MSRKGHTKEAAQSVEEGIDAEPETGVESGDADGAQSDGTDSRIAALEAELAESKDRMLRTLAEADNMRRRTVRDAEDARRFANEKLLADLLPVLDNLQRAIEASAQTENFTALRDGVELTQRQFMELLDRNGLRKIEAVGADFDPNQHEAIMQVPPGDDQEAGKVVEELRTGYSLNDRVLRPSLVKVTAS
jgi:molecular chaperone GrpE